MSTYTLRDRGVDLQVETWVAAGEKKPNCARLIVEGEEVARGCGDELGHLDLGQESGHPTRVAWWWTGRVASCVLVEPGRGEVRHRSTPYAPPPGTRAARLHAWGEAHPVLHAGRHVALQLLGTVAALLGFGALFQVVFGWLLPHLDLGWLPDVAAPEWVKYLNPGRYLAPLFQWLPPLLETLLGWIPDFAQDWVKYVISFLVAVSIAVREVRRRRRVAQEDEHERHDQP